eukprot:Hpha_TRINITY_DN16802_c1_g5::TRINITY_DN16802_c1_g5_i1::g.151049::m.151049
MVTTARSPSEPAASHQLMAISDGGESGLPGQVLLPEAQAGVRFRDLPPLPRRAPKYDYEKWIGVGVVGLGCVLLWGVTSLVPAHHWILEYAADTAAPVMIALAILSTLYILYAEPNAITRTRANAFPIPESVAAKLRSGASVEGMANVSGPDEFLGNYCVRCFIWRPKRLPRNHPEMFWDVWRRWRSYHHHCSVCQRCFSGFDHHCGFYGRCITTGNMVPFVLVIVLGYGAFFIGAGLVAGGGAKWLGLIG